MLAALFYRPLLLHVEGLSIERKGTRACEGLNIRERGCTCETQWRWIVDTCASVYVICTCTRALSTFDFHGRKETLKGFCTLTSEASCVCKVPIESVCKRSRKKRFYVCLSHTQIHTRTHTHTLTYTHTHTHTRTHTHTHTHTPAHSLTVVHTYTHKHKYIHTYRQSQRDK